MSEKELTEREPVSMFVRSFLSESLLCSQQYDVQAAASNLKIYLPLTSPLRQHRGSPFLSRSLQALLRADAETRPTKMTAPFISENTLVYIILML